MARGNQSIQMRLDDATRDRWTSAAQDVGLSLTAFIRETVDAAVGGGGLIHSPMNPDLVGAKMTAAPTKAPGGKAPCPREKHHRPGTFCKACGT